MINLPLHYYSIHRDTHPAAQIIPAQFYLYHLTAQLMFQTFRCVSPMKEQL